MKILLSAALTFLLVTIGALMQGSELPSDSNGRTPVLVELFTSEGCSSCPPADALLQKLDQQPIAGEEMIVLSEHVDYWNHIGWKDPYSSRFYSDRQGTYARRFDLNDVYTPQMVVDGTSQFTGSDAALANKAFATALTKPKIPVRLSSISLGATNVLLAHLETGALQESFGLRDADVYVAVALNRAESQVSGGENSGRKLSHTAVVKSIVKVGRLRKAQTFAEDVQLKLDPGTDARNLRLIAFVQEPGQGRVIGAAAQTVGTAAARAELK
ncbi:MAG TPA: DUF1223 domain-containing protein [Candidatus Angelobacter sp.]|jgi:hypothetical protein|nr:DUF1223 domain-containing protein [Candidatus Angelobacter sp.]